jgi:hypothetical protein
MPAESEKQRRFMGAELARKRAGKKTRTGMSEAQLKDFAAKGKRPRGSGEFTEEDMKRGYKRGKPVNESDLCDVYQPPHDEYGAVTENNKNVGSDYEK